NPNVYLLCPTVTNHFVNEPTVSNSKNRRYRWLFPKEYRKARRLHFRKTPVGLSAKKKIEMYLYYKFKYNMRTYICPYQCKDNCVESQNFSQVFRFHYKLSMYVLTKLCNC